jgi:hypothetical protein
MTTLTHFQSVRVNAVAQLPEPADNHAPLLHLVGRLIQIALSLYLLPAFLVVLVVSGVGIVVLKIDRILTDLFRG